jgi:hypothetical protein
MAGLAGHLVLDSVTMLEKHFSHEKDKPAFFKTLYIFDICGLKGLKNQV